jgi:hypothetical protein
VKSALSPCDFSARSKMAFIWRFTVTCVPGSGAQFHPVRHPALSPSLPSQATALYRTYTPPQPFCTCIELITASCPPRNPRLTSSICSNASTSPTGNRPHCVRRLTTIGFPARLVMRTWPLRLVVFVTMAPGAALGS